MNRNITSLEVAALIHRFLEQKLSYPQEWNDFIECNQKLGEAEELREICHELDPLVNTPDSQDERAIHNLCLIASSIEAGATFSIGLQP